MGSLLKSKEIREMQTKTIVRFYATINGHYKKKLTSAGGEERKGSRGYWWWECKFVEPLWKTVARLLRRLKIQMHMIQLFHYCVVIKRK